MWPLKAISFSHDGKLLASASEDLIIDIGDIATGDKIADVKVDAATLIISLMSCFIQLDNSFYCEKYILVYIYII